MAEHTPQTFEGQLLTLCKELEKWRTEVRQAVDSSPDRFPPFERKAGGQALIFFIVLIIASVTAHLIEGMHNRFAMVCIALVALISVVASPILLIFQAIGLGKKQFWSALYLTLTEPGVNYPFYSLLTCVEYDSSQKERLRPFRTNVLSAALERLAQEESELGERLNALVGNPTLLVVFGVVAGVVTGWENYQSHPDSITSAILLTCSMVSLGAGAYGWRLRPALSELSRCRAFVALEIARRADAGRRDGTGGHESRRRFQR